MTDHQKTFEAQAWAEVARLKVGLEIEKFCFGAIGEGGSIPKAKVDIGPKVRKKIADFEKQTMK